MKVTNSVDKLMIAKAILSNTYQIKFTYLNLNGAEIRAIRRRRPGHTNIIIKR